MYLKYIVTMVLCINLLSSLNATENNVKDNSEIILEKMKKNDSSSSQIVSSLPKIKYTVKVNLLDDAPRLKSYKIKEVNIAKIDSSKLENIFDFDISKRKVTMNNHGSSELMLWDSDNRSIQYFSSGAIFFQNETTMPDMAQDLLKHHKLDKSSGKEFYKNKAIKFLKKNDLFLKNMYYKQISYGVVTQEKKNLKTNKITAIERVVAVGVEFEYTLNDIPIWGPGAITTVLFDETGVSGYFNRMRNFTELEDSDERVFISAKEAVEKYISLDSPRNLLLSYSGKIKEVIIDSVELVYYVKPINKLQKELHPHYLISGKIIGEGDNGQKVVGELKWVEMAKK
jgi:hypothetical protein